MFQARAQLPPTPAQKLATARQPQTMSGWVSLLSTPSQSSERLQTLCLSAFGKVERGVGRQSCGAQLPPSNGLSRCLELSPGRASRGPCQAYRGAPCPELLLGTLLGLFARPAERSPPTAPWLWLCPATGEPAVLTGVMRAAPEWKLLDGVPRRGPPSLEPCGGLRCFRPHSVSFPLPTSSPAPLLFEI